MDNFVLLGRTIVSHLMLLSCLLEGRNDSVKLTDANQMQQPMKTSDASLLFFVCYVFFITIFPPSNDFEHCSITDYKSASPHFVLSWPSQMFCQYLVDLVTQRKFNEWEIKHQVTIKIITDEK
mmetsp:Transcript_36989/g.47568  ORF Transcript_36989/g.47568 Transcript_36989/m.47568 type:complete len:123 (+) Transcript_36989:1649-2017(+)